MRTRLSGIAVAGLIAALSGAACGGDDSGEQESPSKSSDDKESDKVECGTKTCEASADFVGQLCCKAPFESKCGQLVAGTCTDLPPESDKRCKGTSFMAGANPVAIPSCCTEDNQCGVVFTAGIGTPMCTSITQAKSATQRFMTMGMGGMMMFNFTGTLPDAVTCDGDPIESSSGAAGSGM